MKLFKAMMWVFLAAFVAAAVFTAAVLVKFGPDPVGVGMGVVGMVIALMGARNSYTLAHPWFGWVRL